MRIETLNLQDYRKNIKDGLIFNNNENSYSINSNSVEYRRLPKNKVIIEAKNPKTGEILEKRESTNIVTFSGRAWNIEKSFGKRLTDGSSEDAYPYTYYYNDAAGLMILRGISLGYEENRTNSEGNSDILYQGNSFEYEYKMHNPRYIHYSSSPDNFTSVNLESDDTNFYWHDTQNRFDDDLYEYYHFHGIKNINYMIDTGIDDDTSNNMRQIKFDTKPIDSYIVSEIEIDIKSSEYNSQPTSIPGSGNYSGGGNYTDINEIGIFATIPPVDSELQSASGFVPAVLFAKSSFSTIRKDQNRAFTIYWRFFF